MIGERRTGQAEGLNLRENEGMPESLEGLTIPEGKTAGVCARPHR